MRTLVSTKTGLPAVIAVSVFPAEGHGWVDGPRREGGQGQDAGPFGGFGDRLQHECFACTAGDEPGMWSSLHKLRRQDQFAGVVDFEDHCRSPLEARHKIWRRGCRTTLN